MGNKDKNTNRNLNRKGETIRNGWQLFVAVSFVLSVKTFLFIKYGNGK